VNHHRLLRRGRPYGPRIEDAFRFATTARSAVSSSPA
jgi:hypothetical protein